MNITSDIKEMEKTKIIDNPDKDLIMIIFIMFHEDDDSTMI